MTFPAFWDVINLWVLPSWEVQLYLWKFWCMNFVLMIFTFFDASKLTTLTPLSLLLSSKVSASITGIKVLSLPSFALNNRIFIWSLGRWSNTCSEPWDNMPLELSLHFEFSLAHSEWYHTRDPLALYVTSCHKLYSLKFWCDFLMYKSPVHN